MRKKKRRTVRKSSKNFHLKMYLGLSVLFLLFSGGVVILANRNHNSRIASSGTAKNSLQLDAFYPTEPPATTAPQPTATSVPIINSPTTPPSIPPVVDIPTPSIDCTDPRYENNYSLCPECGQYSCVFGDVCSECIDKPVLYLYPKKPTYVNVKVKTNGHVTVSDPLYPVNGWENVLAHTDGSLEYQGKTYSELFYETNVNTIPPPTRGWVIEKRNLAITLKSLTSQLGLKDNEQEELLSYWIQRFNSIKSPYIFISLVNSRIKQEVDDLEITPRPDTFIGFLLYFQPLNEFKQVEPIQLPSPPEREGFTAVEWGGMIAY